MNEENNVEIVKHICQCLQKKDVPGFLSYLSKHIIFKEPPNGRKPFSVTYYGRNEVINFLRNADEAVELTSLETNVMRKNFM